LKETISEVKAPIKQTAFPLEQHDSKDGYDYDGGWQKTYCLM
jgi:hypothetical protein